MKTHDEEHNLMMRVIFGDKETGEIGMKPKVDEMHEILINLKGTGAGLTTLGKVLKWLLIIGAVVALLKGWWAGLITAVAHAIVK